MSEQKFIRVVNWERFQHYKHRNPPWIKLYVEMLSSRTWVTLDDSNRVLAFAVLMLAARHENKIPLDPAYIRRVAYLNTDPNFAGLLETNFVEIVDASNVLAPCTHDASNLHHNALPETEKRQSREEAEKTSSSESKSDSDLQPNPSPKKKERKPPSDKAVRLAGLLRSEILKNKPDCKVDGFESWPHTADLMMDRDGRSYERIGAMIRWAQGHQWWWSRILSMDKLRKQFDALEGQARTQHQEKVNGKPSMVEVIEREQAILRARA